MIFLYEKNEFWIRLQRSSLYLHKENRTNPAKLMLSSRHQTNHIKFTEENIKSFPNQKSKNLQQLKNISKMK